MAHFERWNHYYSREPLVEYDERTGRETAVAIPRKTISFELPASFFVIGTIGTGPRHDCSQKRAWCFHTAMPRLRKPASPAAAERQRSAPSCRFSWRYERMALLKPTPEDKNKLHNEINQYINQRFLVGMTSVTITAVVYGYIITLVGGKPVEPSAFWIAIILNIIVFALFIISQMIQGQIAIIAGYLLVTEASNWEKDWRKYYESTKPSSLGQIVLTGILPFTLALCFSMKDSIGNGLTLAIHIVLCLALIGMVLVTICTDRFLTFGNSAFQEWKQLEEKKDS
jgi:hypothetical protein